MNSPHASFDFRFIYETIVVVPFVEGVSGDEPESERDATSCRLARNHASGRLRKPALRHYERTRKIADDEGLLAFIPRGTGRQ
jgi:hypothetical protein